MSVVGFSLGNLNSYVAVARGGGIDIVINDYSLHATPLCVAFGEKTRTMGVAARSGVSTNFKGTIMNFKQLLGRQFDDPIAQKLANFIPSPMFRGPQNEIIFEVDYLGKREQFTVEQITAAFLVKLKEIAESYLGVRVGDVVISVPPYFADEQRQALCDAGTIAGLNVLNIINDNTAIGIAYGIYKKSHVPTTDKPKIVAFIDVGHSAVTASFVEFQQKHCRVRNYTYDLNVGGLYFDEVVREHFRQEFLQKYKIDAKTNPRAWLRLLDESEKLKKQMSANSTSIPLNIECFMNDIDVTGQMCRAEFEQKAEHLFDRIRLLLRQLIETSNLKLEDIYDVEIVGGSSRIPYFKQIVAHIFNREPKTTTNADDVIARGSAMRCAMLSCFMKVTPFELQSSQNYSICVSYTGQDENEQSTLVFKQFDEFPYNRVITLYKNEPFTISAFYQDMNQVLHTKQLIGTWLINNVTKPIDADFRVIKVKMSLDSNGTFNIREAMYEEKYIEEEVVQENKDSEQYLESDQTQQNNSAEQKEETENTQSDKQDKATKEKKEPKVRRRVIQLPIVKVAGRKYENITSHFEFERQMQETDLNQKFTSDARNALEEYVYSMRDKLSDQYADFVTSDEVLNFNTLLSEIEDWLYGDGENADRATYEAKLLDMRTIIDAPINKRQREKADQEEIERNLRAEKEKEQLASEEEVAAEQMMETN